jgi:hypothetical protein
MKRIKRKERIRPETFSLGPRILEASRGINTRLAMEVRLQAYYKGLEQETTTAYAVAPDGTVHSVTSPRKVAELAEAYRDYLR